MCLSHKIFLKWKIQKLVLYFEYNQKFLKKLLKVDAKLSLLGDLDFF